MKAVETGAGACRPVFLYHKRMNFGGYKVPGKVPSLFPGICFEVCDKFR